MKRPFKDSYLFSYSAAHITYEVDMFFGITKLLYPTNKIGAETIADAKRVNYALIESFGIHLRNLIEFLYTESPKTTDVVAIDYCANWHTFRKPITSTLQKAWIRANKEFAHLTTSRIAGTPPEKKWDFALLAREIWPILDHFTKEANNTALSPQVGEIVRKYIS